MVICFWIAETGDVEEDDSESRKMVLRDWLSGASGAAAKILVGIGVRP
jgi:hypothetical protein